MTGLPPKIYALQQRVFLNCLRFLANDLHLPLVCVGTHEAKLALMTDQQLADRFEARELPVWRDDTTFHQLLASFSSTLPLRQASPLRETPLRKRILNLTDGVTVRICRLLEEAAVQAIATGGERIELETLSEGIGHCQPGVDFRSSASPCCRVKQPDNSLKKACRFEHRSALLLTSWP
jgi:hypothetical protein